MELKIRKPNHEQNCTCKECNVATSKALPANILPIPNVAMPKVGIRYDGFNVYTKDGITNIPSNIYNIFAQLGKNDIDIITQDANSDTLKFDIKILTTIISTNMCISIDSFILTLDNIYSVTVNRMNDKFNEIFVKQIIDSMNTKEENDNRSLKYFSFSTEFRFIGKEEIAKAIITYLNYNNSTRESMYNNIMSYAIAYINRAGLSIYNNFRNEITTLIEYSIVSKYDNMVEKMFSFIEEEFSAMMSNFTYEAGIFSESIINNFDILFDPKKYMAGILRLNNIPDFEYPSKLE